jgi:hypothetical protein
MSDISFNGYQKGAIISNKRIDLSDHTLLKYNACVKMFELFPPTANSTLADVGCNEGLIGTKILQTYKHVPVNVSFLNVKNEHSLHAVYERCRMLEVESHALCVEGDVMTMTDAKYDYVLAFAIVHHLVKQQQQSGGGGDMLEHVLAHLRSMTRCACVIEFPLEVFRDYDSVKRACETQFVIMGHQYISYSDFPDRNRVAFILKPKEI